MVAEITSKFQKYTIICWIANSHFRGHLTSEVLYGGWCQNQQNPRTQVRGPGEDIRLPLCLEL